MRSAPAVVNWIGWAIVAVILAGGCARGGDPPAASDQGDAVVDVRSDVVREQALAEQVQGSGQWRATNETSISASFPAIVDALEPQPGDRVHRGQVLGWLSTRESRTALRGAEAMLREAADSTQRAEARRAVEMTRGDLVRVALVCPADGVVTKRLVEPGAEVAEGAEIIRVVGEKDLVFEAHIPLRDVAHVAAGQPAAVGLVGGGRISAVVRRVLPNTSPSDQSALVWIAPSAPAPKELLDRFGTASVSVGSVRRVAVVPDSAIAVDDLSGEAHVARIAADGRAIWTTVTLGAAIDGAHELLSPRLSPGTSLVTTGLRGLPDSTRVKVVR